MKRSAELTPARLEGRDAPPGMERVIVRMSRDMRSRLRLMARSAGKGEAEIVREILTRGIDPAAAPN